MVVALDKSVCNNNRRLCLASVPIPEHQGHQWDRFQRRGDHVQGHDGGHPGHAVSLHRPDGEERGQLAEEAG